MQNCAHGKIEICVLFTGMLSAVPAQLWLPPKMLTRAPLMVIYKKSFRRYATSRGRMAFKTKYSNCRHNFGRIRPVARFQGLGDAKYIFSEKDFNIYHMLQTNFSEHNKIWGAQKQMSGGTAAECPTVSAGLVKWNLCPPVFQFNRESNYHNSRRGVIKHDEFDHALAVWTKETPP